MRLASLGGFICAAKRTEDHPRQPIDIYLDRFSESLLNAEGGNTSGQIH
jgi:hypothetical protein